MTTGLELRDGAVRVLFVVRRKFDVSIIAHYFCCRFWLTTAPLQVMEASRASYVK